MIAIVLILTCLVLHKPAMRYLSQEEWAYGLKRFARLLQVLIAVGVIGSFFGDFYVFAFSMLGVTLLAILYAVVVFTCYVKGKVNGKKEDCRAPLHDGDVQQPQRNCSGTP